ncbi:MAG: hypothetical protein ACFFA8_08370 [Promethearchaeota archaeon]
MKKQNIIFLLIILIGVGFLIAAISLFLTSPRVQSELYSDWMDHIYPMAMTLLIVGLFIVLFLVCFISQRGKDRTKFSCWDCQP